MTNADVITMPKNGFAPALIVEAIRLGSTDFDVSAQALIDLKNAGLDQSMMEAMLSAQRNKPSAATEGRTAEQPTRRSPHAQRTADASCATARRWL